MFLFLRTRLALPNDHDSCREKCDQWSMRRSEDLIPGVFAIYNFGDYCWRNFSKFSSSEHFGAKHCISWMTFWSERWHIQVKSSRLSLVLQTISNGVEIKNWSIQLGRPSTWNRRERTKVALLDVVSVIHPELPTQGMFQSSLEYIVKVPVIWN